MRRVSTRSHGYVEASILILTMLMSGAAHAAVDKVTSSTLAPIRTPSAPISSEALLDVAIPPLSDGLD